MQQSDYFTPGSLMDTFNGRILKSRAVGLDGERLSLFAANLEDNVALVSRKVLASSYEFTGYREKLISKGASKFPRALSIPTVRDRLTLRAATDCIAANMSSARSRPPHTHIAAIAAAVRGSTDPLSFLRMDVRDFFPSIDHQRLIRELQSNGADDFLTTLVRKALRNANGPKRLDKYNVVGVPQGLSVSNALSSVYMQELDQRLGERAIYHRYVDDILVVCPSKDVAAMYKMLCASLNEIQLNPHPLGSEGKTEEQRIAYGVDYLGYRISRDKVSIRDSSYKRMFANLLKVITSYKYNPKKSQRMLFKLNLRITGCIVDGKRKGWLMFFSQTEDKAQLVNLDRFTKMHLDRVGFNIGQDKLSSFIRAYHEINFKSATSKYIPNFDTYSRDEKVETIATLTDLTNEELNTRSPESIDKEFSRLIAREVSDLEQDVLSAIS